MHHAPHFGDAGQVFKAMFFGSKNVCFTLAQNAGQWGILNITVTDAPRKMRDRMHKKSVGKAGNSKNSNFPLSPLIFYVLLSRIDFQSSSVNIIVTEPH